MLAIAAAPLGVIIAYMLTHDVLIAVYTIFVGVMASTAWISRFPRYRTGIGAMMFLASDLLIFAHMGALEGQAWVGYVIWGLYFIGQVLIVRGVVETLERDNI